MRRKVQAASMFFMENSGFLISGTIIGLLWANGFLHKLGDYKHFVHMWEFAVNDVFMSIFFAVAAKEIAEGIMLPEGSLRGKKALLPVIAACGGVITPSLIYTLLSGVLAPSLLKGFLIPTATDVAFSAAAASIVLGKRHPGISFLLLLAVADDGIGVAAMSVVFAHGFDFVSFFGLGALAVVVAMVTRNFAKGWVLFIPSFVIAWFAFYLGGVHPALSPCLIIPLVPMGKKDVGLFSLTEAPLTKMGKDIKFLSEITLGFFALVNAGVEIGSFSTGTVIVLISLLAGKTIGIFSGALLGAKLLKTDLPEGMDKKSLLVVAMLGGIGFTVAILVTTLSFPEGAGSLKLGALLSFLAFPIAWFVSKLIGLKKEM